MRKTSRYAAFKFAGVSNDTARNIAYKIARMESLSHRLTMGVDTLVSAVE